MAHPLFANCIFMDLLGGEPLLVKDLGRIVAYLAKRGCVTNVSTNGLLLAQRVRELKDAGISRINVSIYDDNRAVLTRDLAAINRIFQVHASYVLLRSAVMMDPQKIEDVVRLAQTSGCKSLRFFLYRSLGANARPDEVILDDPAYKELYHRIEKAFPKFCIWPAALKTDNVRKRCPQLWQRVNSDMLGRIMMCCGADVALEGVGSNLFEAPADVIFNHPAMVEMRTQLLDPQAPPPSMCRQCNLLEDPGW
jgi:hypothetical protein